MTSPKMSSKEFPKSNIVCNAVESGSRFLQMNFPYFMLHSIFHSFYFSSAFQDDIWSPSITFIMIHDGIAIFNDFHSPAFEVTSNLSSHLIIPSINESVCTAKVAMHKNSPFEIFQK